MTSTNESSIETPKSSNIETIVFNNHGEDMTNYSSAPITIYKLNDKNYIQWSQSFMFHVRSKEKEDYLIRNITKPDEKDTEYGIRKRDNSRGYVLPHRGRRPWCEHCHRPGHTKETRSDTPWKTSRLEVKNNE
ncbi:unnamed protein product [Dovyalis caffra]|uniref:Retrotransposon Copia-like N-terminal domain-containing protein n=1 Tax=Dovyalis caffra TaxID=77055 RepID=A0AAV1SIF5_9ROSI|nr:unnamed protein product [Dovyalis caffra]